MKIANLRRRSDLQWEIEPRGAMRVPAVLHADLELIEGMDEKVREQIVNVAQLPGIVGKAHAMADAHWGYGFPIGGVAAFDAEQGGVVSAGGVGFDISCGVRTLLTGLTLEDIRAVQPRLAHALPAAISARARHRQRDEMGTLGSGNHYLEVQVVAGIYGEAQARAFGLTSGAIVVTLHCGSRGLGHQVGTDYLRDMVIAAPGFGLTLPDRELASAPIRSELGQSYLGAMRAAANCALANRQIITHLVREAFARFFPGESLPLLYDVSHNLCREEIHEVAGESRRLFVHRKGATRAFGPGYEELPAEYRDVGQPVLIGGSMGTASYVLAGCTASEALAFSSACHGAGRSMSRHQAMRTWRGREVADELAARGITVVSPSMRGIAEEAPGAYKPVERVVEATERAGLALRVARLEPVIVVKG